MGENTEALTFPDSPRYELDRVLGELVGLANEVLRTQGRLRALLRANEVIVQQLELPVVLRKIVEVAVELVGARYGALGVVSPRGGLEEFITVGMSEAESARIGDLPRGHGVLGALIDQPKPIRVDDLTDDPRSAGFPGGHPAMGSFLGVPIRVRDEVYGNLYLTNREDGPFSADDEELAVALAATAGFAIDNARLFAETKRRQAWAAASAEITAALLAEESGDAISLLASRVLELADADAVRVAVPTGDPDVMKIGTARGADEFSFEGTEFDVAGSLAGTVIEGKQPLLVLGDDDEGAAAPGSLGPMMAVPLLATGRVLGVLLVARFTGRPRFTEVDLELAADFAGQASVAIELARARQGRDRMLLLEDRGRIARDLHDHVIQQLFATGLQLQGLAKSLPAGDSSTQLDVAVSRLDVAIAQIRTAVFALSATPSDHPQSARDRIMSVVNELTPAMLPTPRLTFSGPVDLIVTGALTDDVVAVVRESLTNVAKHSRAEKVDVRATVAEGWVTIEISDDGDGFPADQHPSGQKPRRSGLANLGVRAQKRGGSFTFGSASGETVLVWKVPFDDALAAGNQ